VTRSLGGMVNYSTPARKKKEGGEADFLSYQRRGKVGWERRELTVDSGKWCGTPLEVTIL